MAAGLGIAKAISSKKKSKHFAGEVMDDDTATEDEDDDAEELNHTENIRASNTGFKHSNQLSTDEIKAIENMNQPKKTKSIEMGDGKKIIIMNFTF
jgi:hypothetical protein